jgi:hypothetical protein
MYEIVPGFIASALAIWLVSRLSAAPPADRIALFDRAATAARAR